MFIVTGAAGIIGRCVIRQLQENGYRCIGITRDNFDLSKNSLSSAFASPPIGVIHLAAAVPHSAHYPDNKISAELTHRIDENVFKAVQLWNCQVVYASTCGLYDKECLLVKTEESILPLPTSPYFQAKLDGEHLFQSLDSSIVIRLSAPLGLGIPRSLVVMRFIQKALSGNSVQVWGTGLREQNFVDAEDIAKAMIIAVQKRMKATLNIVANAPVTMMKLAIEVTATLGKGTVVLVEKPDPRDGETARYSNEQARRVLGWSPAISIRESIARIAEEMK